MLRLQQYRIRYRRFAIVLSFIMVVAFIGACSYLAYRYLWTQGIYNRLNELGGAGSVQGSIFAGPRSVHFHVPGVDSSATVSDMLEIIDQLDAIEYLDLSETLADDTVLAHLVNQKRLEALHLEYTEITDAGLSSLQEISTLDYLDLTGTRVSDAGIDALIQMKHLGYICLGDTDITHVGVRKIRAALPDTQVSTDVSVGRGFTFPDIPTTEDGPTIEMMAPEK